MEENILWSPELNLTHRPYIRVTVLFRTIFCAELETKKYYIPNLFERTKTVGPSIKSGTHELKYMAKKKMLKTHAFYINLY